MQSDKEKKFIELMARKYEGSKGRYSILSISEAYAKAGYAPDNSNASKLYKKCSQQIDDRRKEIINSESSPALAQSIIHDIMLDSDINAGIRLKAAQDVLARGGFDKPKESIVRSTQEMSKEEIEKEMQALIQKSENVASIK